MGLEPVGVARRLQAGDAVSARQPTLFEGKRAQMTDSIRAALRSLVTHGPRYDHWSISFSGGKDSTTVLTFVVWAILAGTITVADETFTVKAPKTLTVLRADTRLELPPLWGCSDEILDELDAKRDALKARGTDLHVETVCAPVEDRILVYMLGMGVPPPSNTMRWCTDRAKIEPMERALERRACALGLGTMVPNPRKVGRPEVYQGHGGAQKLLVLTGVRRGESDQRDDRIAVACSKENAECGHGILQRDLDTALADTLAIIDTWRICHVWEWLDLWAPQVTYGDWPGTRLLAMAYGGRDGDEAAEIAARTGCIECPLTKEDRAMLALLRIAKYRYYAPLRELRQLWEWLRSPLVRLRKRGGETRKDGTLAENQNRMGPATIEARREALARVLDIQRRVNEGAAACGGKPICLLDAEEIACIERMHAEGRYPQKWSDADPRATELFDQHYSDGTVQPVLAGLEVDRG